MKFQRVDNSRRADLISRQLRQSIFTGAYRPGERIPTEHELSDAFGVSRIIVREAVRDLERSGLVKVKRGVHGGTFVEEMKHDAVTTVMRDVLELGNTKPTSIIEMRLHLEPFAAGLAAERATSEDIRKMEDHLSIVPRSPGKEYIRWNLGFHRLVTHASHNPVCIILVNILLDLAEDMIREYTDGRIYHDRTSHPAILEKISEKDAEGVRKLFYDHLLVIVPLHEEWEKTGKLYTFSSNK